MSHLSSGCAFSASGSGVGGGCGPNEGLGEDVVGALEDFRTEWHHVVAIIGSYFIAIYRVMLLFGRSQNLRHDFSACYAQLQPLASLP